jgi:hypothetical protein
MLKDILDVGKEYRQVSIILFQYLFRGIGKFEYRKRIGDPYLAKQVWSRVVNNGYVLCNCKLFAYAYHWSRNQGLSTSPARYEIMQEDVALLKSLNLSFIPSSYKPYSLFDYRNFEEAIISSEELRNNIGKFVSKKLIFLDRHFNEKRADIENTLFEASVYAMRKQYPFYLSDLHALNVCKTAARNRGHSLIEYFTRGKRNKLLNENGVFQAVNVPLEAISSLSVQPEHENELKMNLQSLSALESHMHPKVKAFIRTAAGQYDPGFTLYLGVDNTEAVDSWDYSRYLASLKDYHAITEQQVTKLLNQLKRSMS